MEFFENEITKWTNLIDKMTSLPGYRLLTSTSNKLKLFCSHSETPCTTVVVLVIVKGGLSGVEVDPELVAKHIGNSGWI